MLIKITSANREQNESARTLKHEGIRIGEIIAYRAWRVIGPRWWWQGDDRLHSVLMQDYVWHPDEPASGNVQRMAFIHFGASSGRRRSIVIPLVGRHCCLAKSKSGEKL